MTTVLTRQDLIGAALSRLDGPQKVQGQARFAGEFVLDGMVYAELTYSTIPKGRIATLDTSAAEAAPGVVLVMTHRNAPRMNPPPVFLSAPKAAGGDDIPVMQDDRVYWNGQPVALVLAERHEQAQHAASLIRATYEAEPAITSLAAAKAEGLETGVFFGEQLKMGAGDAESALASAPHRVDAAYSTPHQNHNAIELHAATLAWDGDHLFVHDASQAVAYVAWSLAQIFGIAEEQVHVTSPFVGGGFGAKVMWQHQILAAAASRLSGRPVRIVLSREGVYRVVGGRSLTEQRVALGAQADGRLAALIHTGVTPKTRHNTYPEDFIAQTPSAYASESYALHVQVAYMDMLSNTFMRAPGDAVGTFALECAIDELAEELGVDPVELRVRNEPAKDLVSGKPFSSRHIVEAFEAGAERFGWARRNAKPATRREGEWLVGMGCATASFPYVRMPGGAARITLTKDGRATVAIGAHEMGMGTATSQTQIAADRLGLAFEDVSFVYGDSSLPGSVIAGGSQQTAAIAASMIAAHGALLGALLKLVGPSSPLAGLVPEEVRSVDGGLGKVDDSARYESYAAILGRAGRDEVTVEAAAPMPTEMEEWSMHSKGAMFCEARVNAITGEPRVSRFLGSFDCGRIINAKTAASQFRGGIIMGLGLALMEMTELDERNGRIMNASLSGYHVPVHMDVPEIDVIWTDIPDPYAPMGLHGIGEIGITGVGAAVANAVYNAVGKRVRDLPITLDKLL